MDLAVSRSEILRETLNEPYETSTPTAGMALRSSRSSCPSSKSPIGSKVFLSVYWLLLFLILDLSLDPQLLQSKERARYFKPQINEDCKEVEKGERGCRRKR